jgi:hypothetical protein
MAPLVDLAGRTFGFLTVKSRDENAKCRNVYWLCHCTCGASKSIRGASLRDGLTTSCGCRCELPISQRRPPKPGKQPQYLYRRKFGMWTAISPRKDSSGHVKWLCECACGNRQYVEASALTRGRSKSCGCTLWFWPKVVAGRQWNLDNARV